MSVWKKLQRVGKKASKYKITLSLLDITLHSKTDEEFAKSQITFLRRNRKFHSPSFAYEKGDENEFHYTWSPPHNIETETTVYSTENCDKLEPKEWTFQLEYEAKNNNKKKILGSVRKKVLATSQLDISDFVGMGQCQQTLKIVMRVASNSISSVVLNVQLSTFLLRQGNAIDDDLISIGSVQSLARGGSFCVGQGRNFDEHQSFLKRSDTISAYKTSRKMTLQPNDETIVDLNFDDLSKKLESLGKISDDLFTPVNPDSNNDKKDIPYSIENSRTGQEILSWFSSEYEKLPSDIKTKYRLKKPDNLNVFRDGKIIAIIVDRYCPDKVNMDDFEKCPDAKSSLRYITSLCFKEFSLPPLFNNPTSDSLTIITYLSELKSFITNKKDNPESLKTNHKPDTKVPRNGLDDPAETMMEPNHTKIVEKARKLLKSESKQTKPAENTFKGYFYPENNSDDEPVVVRRDNSFNRPNIRETKRKNLSFLNVDGSSKKPNSSKETNGEKSSFDMKTQVEKRVSEIPMSQMKKTSSSLGISDAIQKSSSNVPIKWHKMNNFNLFTSTTNRPSVSGCNEAGSNANPSYGPKTTQHSQSMIEINYGTRAHDFIVMDSDQINFVFVEYESNRLADAQVKLDERANELEKILQACEKCSQKSQKDLDYEDEILKEWLALVNKKSTLIRRSHQLTMIQKENDLKKKAAILRKELAEIMKRDESRRTDEDRKLEKTLMEKLLKNVNERDAIVQELDVQEEGIALDERITEESRKLNRLMINGDMTHYQDNNCLLM